MSLLSERIQADLVAAMKSRDEAVLSVLRMLKSSIQVTGAEKGRSGTLSDDDVQVLIRRALKQREEAAEVYRSANAPERAEAELRETAILKGYLPPQLNDGEIDALVAEIASLIGASGMKDMGRVMSLTVKAAEGRADGKRIKEAVTRALQPKP